MGRPRTGKPLTNEIRYPYIVELGVDYDDLDVVLSRHIMAFHRSRNIRARHGRRTVRAGQIYFRWCFPDLTTAGAFIERFGGIVHKR
jgi:hypothetical protein